MAQTMNYRIVGILRGRPYRSGIFKTEANALKAGYKKVYRKDGNTKRKHGLTSWHIIAV